MGKSTLAIGGDGVIDDAAAKEEGYAHSAHILAIATEKIAPKPGKTDGNAQTETPGSTDSGTQTERPGTADSGTQTEKLGKTDAGTQTGTPGKVDGATQADRPGKVHDSANPNQPGGADGRSLTRQTHVAGKKAHELASTGSIALVAMVLALVGIGCGGAAIYLRRNK